VLRALSVQTKQPGHLSFFAQGLLRQKDFPEADRVIGRLEEIEKERRVESGAFGSIELRAQYWEGKGEPDKGLALLKEYVERPRVEADRIFTFINALAREKRYPAALDVCANVRGQAPVERLAATTLALLRVSQAPEKELATVGDWLRQEVVKKPQ